MSENTYKKPEIKESEEEKEKPLNKTKKGNSFFRGVQSVLDGTILTKDRVVRSLPFMFYLALLAVLYIANSYYSEKKIIEIEKVKKELKELRSENITTKSNFMYYTRQSEVLKRILPYGIKESLIPPKRIFIKKDTSKTIPIQD